MNFKSTIRTTVSSYFGTISGVITGLVSLRLATHFLSTEEFGLWNFTMQTVGYLLLLDLGISSSAGRLFAEPLASGDSRNADAWFTLSLLIMAVQSLVILVLGLGFFPFILHSFNIPLHLQGTASILWMAILGIRSGTLVFSLSFAILHAQNRVYWTNVIQTLGAWGGLASFAVMVCHGWGVMAYAWSAGVSAAITVVGGILALLRGSHRFHLTVNGVNWSNLRRLFGFSTSVFVLALAYQVYFASQALVATKLFGLESAAVLSVTSRAVSIVIAGIWKPLDAFSPRWQIAWCNEEYIRIAREFSLMTRFTILLTVSAAVGVAITNQPFIQWWTKPEYFGGQWLNFWLCVFIVIQGINRCAYTPFFLTTRMKSYTVVNLCGVAAAIALMIVLARWFGLAGIPAGLVLADLLYPMWYYLKNGAGMLKVNGMSLLLHDIAYWFPVLILAAITAFLLEKVIFPSKLVWFVSAFAIAICCISPLLWRAYGLIRQLREDSLG